MSYRTFKRVLGETSLERKCRWWFGISLVVLLTLSFSWYGQRTDHIVYELNRMFFGPELVRTGWLEKHFSMGISANEQFRIAARGAGVADASGKAEAEAVRDLLDSGLKLARSFQWDSILPEDTASESLPLEYLADWSRPRSPSEAATKAADGDPDAIPKYYERYVPEGDTNWYQYYQPMYADQSCISCHIATFGKPRPGLKANDLMAIIRVKTDHQPTADKVAENQAFLWVAAIVVGFVSMFSLWAVVRYVIVKPVKHLRDVSNAVRLGDVEQRAVIRTGDEFEELAAAFNRMLRQLLSQQSELRNVNDELDDRLDELAQANMRLYEMNRLKSDFLATVSHELRTPLNSILGFSDVLSGIDALDDKQKRYVGNIQRSGAMLLEMINDILDLAKVESGKMEVRLSEFRIGALVAAQCDMARPLAEKKNLELEHNISSGLPPLRQDQAKVQQILNNLLSNAIKFTPEGGRISISAERNALDDLRLTVTDTGIGISPDDQQLVFEKFRQAGGAQPDGDAMTREFSGTGLGLSIVRELCRLLGGDVSLESELGKGSTFTVRLPWRLEEVPRLDSQLREDLETLSRSVRIAAHESSAGGFEPEFASRGRGSNCGTQTVPGIADCGLKGQNPQSAIRKANRPLPVAANSLPSVHLFTDGACSGNPGPGGWAFVLRHPASGKELEKSGGERQTTNNRMELTAVVRGLEALKSNSRVELFTDSVYVGKGISEWLPKWKANGWRRKERNKLVPIANEELWRNLDALLAKHSIKYTRVAGHSGHEENDRVDQLAVAAYQQYL